MERKRKMIFMCINHDTPHEMIIREGQSVFYACPKFDDDNLEPGERKCLNRMTFIDAGGIIDKFAEIEDSIDPLEGTEDLTGYEFGYRGLKSRFKVIILKINEDEVRFGIKNLTVLHQ